MIPGTDYKVQRGKGDPTSTFLTIKLSVALRAKLQQHPHDSSIEFTSPDSGLIHIGNESHTFSIQKDTKMEMYEMCLDSSPTASTSADTTGALMMSFLGPVAGKVSVHQKGITSQDTARIRQRTEIAERESRSRQTVSLPLPLPGSRQPSSFSSSFSSSSSSLSLSVSPRRVRLPPPTTATSTSTVSAKKRTRDVFQTTDSAVSASASTSASPAPTPVHFSLLFSSLIFSPATAYSLQHSVVCN